VINKSCLRMKIENKGHYFWIKRLMDVILSLFGIIVLSPVMLLIAILVKLDSKGPVIYIRDMLGKDFKHFIMFKFRSMVKDSDKILEDWKKRNKVLFEKYNQTMKLNNDPRVTKLGKVLRSYNLDEIPQLFNVFMGDMSLFGPRPIVDSEVDRMRKLGIGELNIRKRFSVRPGMAGSWQINRIGEHNEPYERRIRFDVDYVENLSFFKDIKIAYGCFLMFLYKAGIRKMHQPIKGS
jgi:lipopolysaccharide/colanic/teichoic acid biosynthesis glycosyltransferase